MFIIKKPHHTEKSLGLNSQRKYTFIVLLDTTKNEIKKQIAQHYNVTVTDVNTIRYKSKKITRYTRKRVFQGRRPRYKKAIVTLAQKDIIDVYADPYTT